MAYYQGLYTKHILRPLNAISNSVCTPAGNCQETDHKKWKKLHTLDEHDLLVSAIDWSAATNLIVTCSHDRNAFVWTYSQEESTWKPSLVILRIDRAALDVKWSPDGRKFAVASGAKCVPVCYFESGEFTFMGYY